MPKPMSFYDDSSGDYSSPEEFPGYDRFEAIQEKQSFFATSGTRITYRIYDRQGLFSILEIGTDGSYERSENVFKVKSQITPLGRDGSFLELEVRRENDAHLLAQGLFVGGKSIISVRGTDFIRTLVNREATLASLHSQTSMAARMPIWKDSDQGKGLLCRIYVRSNLNDEERDLMIIALSASQDRSLWSSLVSNDI